MFEDCIETGCDVENKPIAAYYFSQAALVGCGRRLRYAGKAVVIFGEQLL